MKYQKALGDPATKSGNISTTINKFQYIKLQSQKIRAETGIDADGAVSH